MPMHFNTSVYTILHEHLKVRTRWIPHLLADAQKSSCRLVPPYSWQIRRRCLQTGMKRPIDWLGSKRSQRNWLVLGALRSKWRRIFSRKQIMWSFNIKIPSTQYGIRLFVRQKFWVSWERGWEKLSQNDKSFCITNMPARTGVFERSNGKIDGSSSLWPRLSTHWLLPLPQNQRSIAWSTSFIAWRSGWGIEKSCLQKGNWFEHMHKCKKILNANIVVVFLLFLEFKK